MEELKADVADALDGVECAGYREAARVSIVEQDNGNIKIIGGMSKSLHRERQEIKREQLNALDDANLEWHYKKDGRFKNGYRVDTVIITGKKQLAADGGDRTTINVDKETHSEASQVKDEHGETWPEVLQWYAENRDGDTDTDTNDDTEPMQVVPVDEVVGREVPKTTVQLEATEYSKIADELEGRLR